MEMVNKSHGEQLKEVYSQLLVAGQERIVVVAGDGVELVIQQAQLTLLSPLMRSCLASLPPSTAPPTLLLPDTASRALLGLRQVLATGQLSLPSTSQTGEVCEAARLLGINIGLELERPAVATERASENRLNRQRDKEEALARVNLMPAKKKSRVNQVKGKLSGGFLVKQEPRVPTTPDVHSGKQFFPSPNEAKNKAAQEPGGETRRDKNVGEKQDTATAVDTTAALKCENCPKMFPNLLQLKYHYIAHFKVEILSEYSSMISGSRCLECDKTFVADKIFTHVGIHHMKIDEVLKSKGIALTPPSQETMPQLSKNLNITLNQSAKKQQLQGNANITLSPSVKAREERPSKPATKSNTQSNNSLTCQVCDATMSTTASLEQHICSVHFYKELEKEVEGSMTEDLKCQKCGSSFKMKKSLVLHLGSKHSMINNVLKQKLLPLLTTSLSNNSLVSQKKLVALKQEAVIPDVETEVSFNNSISSERLLADSDNDTQIIL